MNKLITLLLVVLVVVLLSGCNASSTSNTFFSSTFETTTSTSEGNEVEICDDTGSIPKYKVTACSPVIMVLPDTQLYTLNNQVAPIFYSQMNWIVENKSKYQIKFTGHLGDLVNEPFNKPMWDIADKAFKIFDNASIPYGVTAGNHDFQGTEGFNWYGWDDNSRSKREFYLKYFSAERTSQVKENYGGHTDNGWNSYYFFEGNNRKYMVLFVDYAASDETFAWANTLLQQNRDIPTIVLTHVLSVPTSTSKSYIELDGAKEYWEKLIYDNDQIFMAINGHYAGSGYEIKTNKYGNEVLLVVVDYQGETRGGNGWFRMIELDEINNKIHARSFSPYIMNLPAEEREYGDVVQLLDSSNHYSISWDYNNRFNFYQ